MAAPSKRSAVALATLGLLVAAPYAEAETRQLSDANNEVLSAATPEPSALPAPAEASGPAPGQTAAPAQGYDSLAPAPPAMPIWQSLLNTVVQLSGAASR